MPSGDLRVGFKSIYKSPSLSASATCSSVAGNSSPIPLPHCHGVTHLSPQSPCTLSPHTTRFTGWIPHPKCQLWESTLHPSSLGAGISGRTSKPRCNLSSDLSEERMVGSLGAEAVVPEADQSPDMTLSQSCQGMGLLNQ